MQKLTWANIKHPPCCRAGVPFLDSAAEQITRKIEQFSPQDATNAVWAFAQLFHYPNQAFLKVHLRCYKSRAAAIFLNVPQQADARLLSTCAGMILCTWGSTFTLTLALLPLRYDSYVYLQAVSLFALRTWSRFKASDMSAVLWALAVLKAPTLDMYCLLLEKLAQAPVSAFADAELSDIYAAYVLLDQHSAHSHARCTPVPSHPPLVVDSASTSAS